MSKYKLIFYVLCNIFHGIICWTPPPIRHSVPVCQTRECDEVSTMLRNRMDTTKSPCDDFHDFGCRQWNTRTVSRGSGNPTDLSSLPHMQKVQKIRERMIDILTKHEIPREDRPLLQTKKFFESCMNTKEIDKKGISPIKEVINRNGGWPITTDISKRMSPVYTWQFITNLYYHQYGFTFFFEFRIITHYEVKRHILTLNHDVKIPCKYIISGNPESVMNSEKYKRIVTSVVKAFTPSNCYDLDRINRNVVNLLEFEKKLYKIFTRNRNGEPKLMNFEKLQNIYNGLSNNENSKIDFLEAANRLASGSGIKLTKDDIVQISPTANLLELAELLEKTPPFVIINYIQWSVVAKLLTYVGNLVKFKIPVEFDDGKMPRWKTCLKLIFKHPIARKYTHIYLPERSTERVKQIITNIKQAMSKHIEEAIWIENEMRPLFKKKLNMMTEAISHPSWYDTDDYYRHYNDIHMGNSFFDNILSSYKHFTIVRWRVLNRNLDDPLTLTYIPLEINAFYQQSRNTIVIPVSLMDDVLFHKSLPSGVIYGYLGSIIGHEIGHLMDPEAIHINENGIAKEWLSKKTVSQYHDEVYCLYKQYSFFSSNECATLTSAENVADNIGSKIAYEALLIAMKTEKNLYLRLPGFSTYSNKQLFFITLANVFCASQDLMLLNTHSCAKLRINIPFSNMVQFAENFDCSSGDYMSPKMKCYL